MSTPLPAGGQGRTRPRLTACMAASVGAVVLVAIGVLAVSVVGLYWLFQ